MFNRCALFFTLANLLIVAAFAFMWQHNENTTLRSEVRLYQQMQKLSDDQISELQYLLTSQRLDLEAERTRSYVSGVVDTVTRPERANEIWHAGYDRGQSVQQYADQTERTSARYTESEANNNR